METSELKKDKKITIRISSRVLTLIKLLGLSPQKIFDDAINLIFKAEIKLEVKNVDD